MNKSKNETARERQWLLDEKYAGIETPKFFDDLTRLEDGEPLAYLIGQVPFLDATIFLDSRPLIPRPETEYWTERAITEIKKATRQLSILDLCAGSGCIGVAALKAVPNVCVDFCEIDANHHETIRKNVPRNGIDPSRARVYGGDLFSDIGEAANYNFILANPPYLDPKKTERLEKNVIDYEPAQALFGGADGMEYITRIISNAPQYLAKPGVLYIEHEPEQTGATHALAHSLSYTSCETYSDQWKINRYTRLVRAG